MTKFKDLLPDDLIDIADKIDAIFDMYGLDDDSKEAFWECVNIGNKKFDLV
jgi:hypothetical protein